MIVVIRLVVDHDDVRDRIVRHRGAWDGAHGVGVIGRRVLQEVFAVLLGAVGCRRYRAGVEIGGS